MLKVLPGNRLTKYLHPLFLQDSTSTHLQRILDYYHPNLQGSLLLKSHFGNKSEEQDHRYRFLHCMLCHTGRESSIGLQPTPDRRIRLRCNIIHHCPDKLNHQEILTQVSLSGSQKSSVQLMPSSQSTGMPGLPLHYHHRFPDRYRNSLSDTQSPFRFKSAICQNSKHLEDHNPHQDQWCCFHMVEGQYNNLTYQRYNILHRTRTPP